MSDDLLERATRALRETSAPSPDDLAETRARLLTGTRSSRAQRARALRWVLPLAAAFVAGSAFAATNGQLERALHTVSTWLSSSPAPVVPAKRKKGPARPRRAPAIVSPPEVTPSPDLEASTTAAPGAHATEERAWGVTAAAEPASPDLRVGRTHRTMGASRARAPSERSASRDGSRARGPRGEAVASSAPIAEEGTPHDGLENTAHAVSHAASDEASAPEPSPNPDLVRYRQAHRLHFTLRHYREALRAWDAYLAEYPTGIFAQEARYNRAICLVHLKRIAEARTALEPFARGEVASGYRRDQARALLEALPSTP